MRAHGLLGRTVGAEPDDHICWVYADTGSFGAAAGHYLAEGLARGERLLFVGDGGAALREGAEPGSTWTACSTAARSRSSTSPRPTGARAR